MNYTKIESIVYPIEDNILHPWIVAPLPVLQDTFLLTPKNLFGQKDEFVNKLYSNNNLNIENNSLIRIFTFKEQLIVSLIFHSASALEKRSQRAGLKLSIGFSIDKSWAKKTNFNLVTICKDTVDYFNQIFNINLYEGGATEVLNDFQKEYSEIDTLHLNEKVEKFKQLVVKPYRKPRYSIRLILFPNLISRYINKKRGDLLLPNIILCEESTNTENIIEYLCDKLDLILHNQKHELDINIDTNNIQIIQNLQHLHYKRINSTIVEFSNHPKKIISIKIK